MALHKIISGGQTGADIAGIDAAVANGIPYGGWLPKGRKTEIGPLDEKYKMVAMVTGGYLKRTKQNVIDSDGTVILTHGRLTGGSKKTSDFAVALNRPWLHLNMLELSVDDAVTRLLDWIKQYDIGVLNVAGSRASKDGDIYNITLKIIGKVCRHFVRT